MPRTVARTSNHQFQVGAPGLYLKSDRTSSLLVQPARTHHPFPPDLIRNTSAMFIFLYKSKAQKRFKLSVLHPLDCRWKKKWAYVSVKPHILCSLQTPSVRRESISNTVHQCHLVFINKLTWSRNTKTWLFIDTIARFCTLKFSWRMVPLYLHSFWAYYLFIMFLFWKYLYSFSVKVCFKL